MKVIELDTCAYGIEPEGAADRLESVDIARLRKSGINETMIGIVQGYLMRTVGGGEVLPTGTDTTV